MGLRINTNVASLAAQRALSQSQKSTERSMKQLATGNRFADLSEGSADFAIAEHLKGQTKGMAAAKNNAENAVSFVQVAEGGLNEQNNLLIRMRELAIQSASDTFSDTEREMIEMEFQQLLTEFDRIAKTTSFGSQKLLSGVEKDYEFQVGAYKGEENIIRYQSNANTTASELGLDGMTVIEKTDARDSLETIDIALTSLGRARANFGAMQSRFDSVTSYTAVQMENLQAAQARIADTDVAKATSEMAKGIALQQYQLAVLATANQVPGQILKLIA
ncbi:MAG: flagellin [Oligoflexia bacterium]|nr:MAG: flagellin [Oligoflexia bacterium]